MAGNLMGYGNLMSLPSSTKPFLDFEAIKQAANGHWINTIFPAVGINFTKHHSKPQPCPVCSGRDRFRCDDKQGTGTWYCNQCIPNAGNGFTLVQSFTGMDAYETNKTIAGILGIDTTATVSQEQRDAWRERQVEREVLEDEQKAQKRAEAAIRAENMWGNAKAVDQDHAYLVRKAIVVPPSIKQLGIDLIVPMYQGNDLVNMQTIAPNGYKLFLTDGVVTGAYHIIYDKATVDDGILLLCEGYATGVTLFNAMNGTYPVAVAFNANNLTPVALSLREQYPLHRILISADNDDTKAREAMVRDITDGKIPKNLNEYNTGLREAKKAAEAVNGELIMLGERL